MIPTTAAATMVHITIITMSLDWILTRDSKRRRDNRLNLRGSLASGADSDSEASCAVICTIGIPSPVRPARVRTCRRVTPLWRMGRVLHLGTYCMWHPRPAFDDVDATQPSRPTGSE